MGTLTKTEDNREVEFDVRREWARDAREAGA